MLTGVCFAFLMCIHTEVECCMTWGPTVKILRLACLWISESFRHFVIIESGNSSSLGNPFYETRIHIRKAKHTPNTTISVLFKALWTLDLKPRGYVKWSNSVQFHGIPIEQFSWHQSLNCPACAKISLVYWSVHETCAKRFLLHYSVAFLWPYIPVRKKTKNTINMTF